ncbi:MAG: ADP-heptose--LPS heptosyltransferase 2 [Chlamydiae bacterium]|nr:ADP-heptose--LPS heptosyltransferase 2 [Chlamydiota bacterium]
MKIVIRMPNWLGDLVMATPIIRDVRQKYPNAHITAMCQTNVAPLLHANPHLDRILTFSEKRQAIKALRGAHFDFGILLTNSLSSAWLFWRGGVKKRRGFISDGRRLLLNDPVPMPKERGQEHLVTTYKRLLSLPLSDSAPELFVTQEEKETVLKKYDLPKDAKIIGVNPGAAYGPAKCWLPDRFRAVTEKLLKDEQVHLLYFGDQASGGLIQEICRKLPSRVIDLSGKTTLRELIALIERCDVFLTNDSGPMHIAAALKTPLVALFGSTNDVATGPYKHGTVIHKHVHCSPCYLRTCPTDFICMKSIEVDEVYEAVLHCQ